MYIPKSQIIIKTTRGNEFVIQRTGAEYVGDYLETSNGLRYAGTNNMNLGPIIVPIPPNNDGKHTQGSNVNIKRFNIRKKSIKEFLINTDAIPSMKRYPSETDYNQGFFIRYFSRRIKSVGYQEIDKEVYDSISKKNGKYDHNLYEVGSLRWNLKGNVFKDNALALQAKERTFRNISYLFPIFDEFAREPMKNQENLHTSGKELYYGDGTEYIGAYHVHMTSGPMVGAYHTESEHPKLYYISELPSPSNMTYEEFLTNYPPPNAILPILPISNDVRGTTTTTTPTYVGESYNCIVSWGPPPPGYEGFINMDGNTVVGSACVDPGDGTGTYRESTYGSSWNMACHAQCEGAYINDTSGGFGCMMPWDPSFCSTCTYHDQNMCTGQYNTGLSGGGSTYGNSGGMGTSYTGNCFTGKTPIIMEDETFKRIDEIIVGDIVKSEINTSKVIGIDIHKEEEYTIYSINNSEAFVTAEHPFKTTTGWKAIDPLETFKKHGIESNVLEIGNILITKEGTEEVKSIRKSTKTINTVYNLQLDNEHVYYANGYLVHNNKSGGAWSMDEIEIMWDDYGGMSTNVCPCGIFQGVMQYSETCC
jgi:hypothetical protein